MSDQPTVALALIVKNEADNLSRLLASVEGCFDEVVLVDTGSRDKTIEVFEAWCATERERQPTFRHVVGHFDWVHDFAAARNHADTLTTCEWQCWADADDEIRGAQNLRTLAAQAPADLAGFMCGYDYAQTEGGTCCCYLIRERLVRRGWTNWIGRVHEAQLPLRGGFTRVDASICEWVHRKHQTAPVSQRRNLRILRGWLKDEPTSPRVLGYLGTEELGMGRHGRAISYFRRYLKLKTGWDEERCQVHRKLSIALAALDRPAEARDVALEALKVMPNWADTYLSLAQASFQLEECGKAIEWAQRVLEIGQPDTMLIVNPLDYTLLPRTLLAAAHGQLGQIEEAIDWAEQAAQIAPDHEELQRHLAGWKATSKRNLTAQSLCAYLKMLVDHDEQLKAFTVAEQGAPYFVTDHPDVVQIRSLIRERVRPLLDSAAEHYEPGTEEGVTDLNVIGMLPRARFLAAGLNEQLEEAA